MEYLDTFCLWLGRLVLAASSVPGLLFLFYVLYLWTAEQVVRIFKLSDILVRFGKHLRDEKRKAQASVESKP